MSTTPAQDVSLQEAVAAAKGLEPLDNPEYFRGICELLARLFPTVNTDTLERSQQIARQIKD